MITADANCSKFAPNPIENLHVPRRSFVLTPVFRACLFSAIMNQALHHPFTAPNPEDMNDLPSARALAYDMIYNGVEVYPIFIFLSLHAS